MQCGVACLASICEYYGKKYSTNSFQNFVRVPLPLGVHSMFNYSIDNARFKCRFR